MTSCAEVRDLLQPFQDGELGVEQNVAILKHLELCPPCAARRRELGLLCDLVARAAPEPCPAAARDRLLGGAFARLEREEGAAPPGRLAGRWPRRWLAAAAALLVTLGGAGGLRAADPFCWWGCPTLDEVERAQAACLDDPLCREELQARLQAPVGVPSAGPLTFVGGQVVELAARRRAVLRYRCPVTRSEMTYVQLPKAHLHVGEERTLPDGSRCRVGEYHGVRFVAWRDAGGETHCCLGDASVPSERLLAMARLLRG